MLRVLIGCNTCSYSDAERDARVEQRRPNGAPTPLLSLPAAGMARPAPTRTRPRKRKAEAE